MWRFFDVAFHGTKSLYAVRSIFVNGFDPWRRTGQLMGPGEYFAKDISISEGYTGGTGLILASLILRVPNPPSDCYCTMCRVVERGNVLVVNNPLDSSITYCLPIAVKGSVNY